MKEKESAFSDTIRVIGKIKQLVNKGVFFGTVDCTKCGGSVQWSAAPSNKHTRGRCDKCGLSWME